MHGDETAPFFSLNLRVRGLPQSATLAINDRSNRLRQAGKTIYKLGLGQSPFPVPRRVVESLQAHASHKEYLPVAGLPELRQAVANYHGRVDGVHFDADDIMVGPGSKELLFLLQLAYYGDLLIPAPCWVSYAPQANIIGRQVRLIQTTREEGWRLTPARLRTLCADDADRPRLLILNYPGNPDGSSYTAEELQVIAEVAREFRIVLLSDEIYGPLDHADQHISIATFYPEGTIISGGLSKWCGAGGWRLGTFAFPKALSRLLASMAATASETFTSTSAPIQYAAITAFTGGADIDLYLVQCRRILQALGQHCASRLRQAGATLPEPRGGFYLFPDFEPLRVTLRARGMENGRALAEHALDKTGVAFLPAEDFGLPAESLAARLAYVDFDGEAALEAAAALPKDARIDETFLRDHCSAVVEGIDTLCAWLLG